MVLMRMTALTVHHHLHVLDLIAAQLVKFVLVAHLPAVDVDERSATAYDLNAVAIANYTRDMGVPIFER